jgi:PAS domain S-box-containing protein
MPEADLRANRFPVVIADADQLEETTGVKPGNEALVRALLDTVPALMWSANPDGELSYLNQQCVDYTGRTLKDFVSHGWTDLIHPDDLDETLKAWSYAAQTSSSYHVKYRLRRADGDYRWFLVRGEPLRDTEGRVVQFYGINVDIDAGTKAAQALQSAQEKLAHASKIATVAELSASIAHELNQPLQAIVANGHACQRWLASSPPNIEQALRAAERVVRDGHNSADVLRRTRALFKHSEPTKVDLDLNKLIIQVCAMMADELLRNAISVDTALAEDLPATKADAVQLQQVLVNLVRNAIEAMAATTRQSRSLLIRSRRDGESFVVDVKDQGTGLHDAEKIFEPFITTKETGMGMGLAICRSIVEAHSGRIWVVQNEGAGVTFSFSIPLEAPEST